MLYREIMAVCSEVYTKHTKTVYGQIVSVKPDRQWLFDFMCPLIWPLCIIDVLFESKAPSKLLPVNVQVMRMSAICVFC
jgi:hypothetical protein